MGMGRFHQTTAGKRRDRQARKNSDKVLSIFSDAVKETKKAEKKYKKEYAKLSKNATSLSDLKKARKAAKKAAFKLK